MTGSELCIVEYAKSGDAHDAMFIYFSLEMTGCELYCTLWNMPESGDTDDAMSIYSAVEMIESEL
jgi:hypothetical protein